MPHIDIYCYPGRSDGQKADCASKVADIIAETLGCDTSSVSVAIKEVQKEDWKEQIWDVKIAPEQKDMYKKPGYQM